MTSLNVRGGNPAPEPNKPAPSRSRRKTPVRNKVRAGNAAHLGPRRGGDISLTPVQRAMVDQNIGLVALHLRTHVPTPREPTRDRDRDDLFQEGCLALARAAATYDPAIHGSFATYALYRIRGSIHLALHEHFSTIHVPTRHQTRLRNEGRQHAMPITRSLQATDLELGAEGITPLDASRPEDRTLRHELRDRFMRAVECALETLSRRPWRRHDPSPILKRLARDRLLVDDPGRRLSLRRLAAELKVSCGRLCNCEQTLNRQVAEHFRADPHVPLLLEFARDHPAGLDAPVTPAHQERLRASDVRAFADRFERMDRARRGELLYAMIERSTPAIGEVAANLYRLTRFDDVFATLDHVA